MPIGRATPWPNRAETAVRLFKRQYEKLLMDASVNPTLSKVTLKDLIRECCWARNTTLTISGYTPVELATGRRPTDHSDLELMKPDQLSAVDLPRDATLSELRKLVLWAHLEARQSADLRRDLARRVLPSDAPYAHGDRSVCLNLMTRPSTRLLAAGLVQESSSRMEPLLLWRQRRQCSGSTNPRSEETMTRGMMYHFLGTLTSQRRMSFDINAVSSVSKLTERLRKMRPSIVLCNLLGVDKTNMKRTLSDISNELHEYIKDRVYPCCARLNVTSDADQEEQTQDQGAQECGGAYLPSWWEFQSLL